MADPGIISDQILELFFGYWRCAAGNDQNRAALAVRCQARGRAAPRFAHQAATNRQPFGKGPRIDGQHVPVQGHTTAPAMASTSSTVIASRPLSPARRAVVVPVNPAGFAFAFHHRCPARYARPDDGSAPPAVRHPRLGDRGTYIASHIPVRDRGLPNQSPVTADENTP